MAEIKEEIKCPSSVPSPIVSPVVSPKLSETEPKGKFLKSQLVVLEAEIVSLRSDKALLETDKGELEASLEKLQETVRNADDTTLVLKEENKTLIIESQKHSQENVQLKKTIEELKRRQLQLNEELQQRQKLSI